MRRSFLLLVLAAMTAVAGWPGRASAKPKSITFQDMMAQSATVAVARRVTPPPQAGGQPKEFALELLEVLKGDIQPGRLNVPFEDAPCVADDSPEFVVFLDKDCVWRFVAVPTAKGGKVAESVLELHGFYDFNAHHVTPGLATRKMLEAYIKDGTLVYLFRGPLYFPVKGEVSWKASAIEVEGGYDPLQKSGRVKGLPAMKGLPAVPDFGFLGDTAPCVDLEYSGQHRRLHLKGDVAGLDRKNDTILLKWYATAPDFLTQKDFETYLADPALVDAQFRVTLNFRPINEKEKRKVLTLNLGESGRTGRLEGWADKPLAANGCRWTDKWIDYAFTLPTGEELVVHLDYLPRPAGAEVMTWVFQNGLLYRLHTGDLAGSLLFRQNKEDRLHGTCTATLAGIFYEKSN
jgi:hypothetical protein